MIILEALPRPLTKETRVQKKDLEVVVSSRHVPTSFRLLSLDRFLFYSRHPRIPSRENRQFDRLTSLPYMSGNSEGSTHENRGGDPVIRTAWKKQTVQLSQKQFRRQTDGVRRDERGQVWVCD